MPVGPTGGFSTGRYAGGRFPCADAQPGRRPWRIISAASPGITNVKRPIKSGWRARFPTLGRRDEALKAADAIIAKDPKNLFARALKVQLLDQMGGAQNLNTAAGSGGRSGQGSPGQLESANAGRPNSSDQGQSGPSLYVFPASFESGCSIGRGANSAGSPGADAQELFRRAAACRRRFSDPSQRSRRRAYFE